MDGPAFQRQDCKLFRALRTTNRLPAPSPTAQQKGAACVLWVDQLDPPTVEQAV